MKTLVLFACCTAVLAGSQAARVPAPSAPQGTARIAGVVRDGNAQPVRAAVVRLTGADLPTGRATITDDNGAFVFEQLPAGRLSLTASKPAYLATAYGAVRPGGAGTPLSMTDGQQLAGIALTMARGGAITGIVRDETGAPVPDVQVAALKPDAQTSGTSAAARRPEFAYTDDRGVYRIFGLAPGTYYVMVDRGGSGGIGEVGMMSASEVDATFARLQRGRSGASTPTAPPERSPSSIVRPTRTYTPAPIFYPAAVSADAATPISLALSEVREGVDVVYQLVRTVAVSGTINGVPQGQAVQLSLSSEGRTIFGRVFGSTPFLQRRASDGDGAFVFTGVTPGNYALLARSVAAGRSGMPPAQMFAKSTLAITGDDVAGVALTMQPTLRVGGRVIFRGAAQPPAAAVATFAVRLMPEGLSEAGAVSQVVYPGTPTPIGSGPLNPDGTFQIVGVLPGKYRFSTVRAPAGWWTRSAMVGSVDAMDAVFEVQASDISGIEVTMSNQRSQLTGRLLQADGTPGTGYFVIAFSTDRAVWQSGSRRLRSVRPGTDGSFRIDDLPAGEYYLAALTDADSAEWQATAFLSQVVPSAIRLTLAEGQRTAQDLRIAR